VRGNAAHLLFDAFPLQDPCASNEETDDVLNQQFKCLASLLKDPAPVVRAQAVTGTLKVLDTFWELIPAVTTASFIACMVDEMVHDAAAAGVRGVAESNQPSHTDPIVL
jgi:condensin-2 complex subunit G2